MQFGFLHINSQNLNHNILKKKLSKIPGVKCKGSDKVGLHYLVVIEKDSPNLICTDENCDIMYYNVESDEWYNKPVLKNSQKASINKKNK